MAEPARELSVFVKKPTRGLIMFLDSSTESLVGFKKCINKTNYNGAVKYFRKIDEAVDFLKTVNLPNKAAATADLIFC